MLIRLLPVVAADLFFQFCQSSRHRIELMQTYSVAPPLAVRLVRITRRIDPRLVNRTGDKASAGDLHIIDDGQMAVNTDVTANRTALPDHGTAGNASTGGDCGVRTNTDIVTDLNLVIQFYSVADLGIAEGAAINRRITADFDIIADNNPPDLGYFDPDTVVIGEAKTVRTQHGARMDQTTLADPGFRTEHNPRIEATAGTDMTAGFDDASRADLHAGVNADIGTDDTIWSDPAVCGDTCRGIDDRLRMYTRRKRRRWIQ